MRKKVFLFFCLIIAVLGGIIIYQALELSDRQRQREALHEIKGAAREELADRLPTDDSEMQMRSADVWKETLRALRECRDDIRELQSAVSMQKRTGFLRFKNSRDVEILYLGEMRNGKANGFGQALWATGSTYSGGWRENRRHGRGEYHWKDGERYIGNFMDDRREGQGTYFWLNGERYEGEFKADTRHGRGILYAADGTVKKKGLWQNDKYVNGEDGKS